MGALTGIRVLDLSTVIAAPFASAILADFGAEVIKVEMPETGDPFRALGPYRDGESIRWPAMGRNKKCVTLNLHTEEGRQVFLDLAAKSDLVLENFRTGTLDRWGLTMEAMREANPRIVTVRVTGYGQTGPYKDMAGFGTPATAFSGMTYITGYPDKPPVSPSFSLADYIAGLNTVIAAMIALYHRDALGGKGQEADVSLYEGIFRMQEILVADYFTNGVIRERKPKLSGTSSPGGTFRTRDGKWVVLVCSTDRTFEYLTRAMKRPELMEKYANNADRLRDDAYMDKLLTEWIGSDDYVNIKAACSREGVPISLIYSMEDIANDPQYRARNNIVEMPHSTFGSIKMPGVTPVFSETPGEIKWIGPKVGEHNDEIYRGLLGMSEEKMAALREKKVI